MVRIRAAPRKVMRPSQGIGAKHNQRRAMYRRTRFGEEETREECDAGSEAGLAEYEKGRRTKEKR